MLLAANETYIEAWGALGQTESRPTGERQEYVAENDIEGNRGQLSRTVRRTDGEGLSLPFEEMTKSLVRAHNALGETGGPRREEDIARAIRVEPRQRDVVQTTVDLCKEDLSAVRIDP